MNYTYVVAIVGVIWGIVGMIFGFIDGATASTIILGSLSVFGLRKAQKAAQIGGRSRW